MIRPLLLALALCGCPHYVRPNCPTPGIYSCVGDQPHVCGTTRHLTPIGNERCAPQGRVCGLNAEGTATCLPRPE
jgi:hypothetical protein